MSYVNWFELLSDGSDLLTSKMKQTDLSKTDLHIGIKDKSPDKYQVQHEEV